MAQNTFTKCSKCGRLIAGDYCSHPTTNEIQIEILQQKLNDLVYLNEDTMSVPFDDYQIKRNELETQIKQLTKENK